MLNHAMRLSPRPKLAIIWLALFWLVPLAYLGLIWWAAIEPIAWAGTVIHKFPFLTRGGDKLIHFLEFGLLGFLISHAAFYTWGNTTIWRFATLTFAVTVFFGLLDELHQIQAPFRQSDPLDFLADTCGALVGVSLRSWIAYKSQRNISKSAGS